MTKITRFIPWSDPLVLDLDGDGFETTPLSKTPPVMFDGDADAIKNATAWIGSDDGLVVLDRNGNGSIDNGGELFGDSTILTTGPDIGKTAAHGFVALADLDSNLDGLFNASDAQFGAVRIWRDFNQDGLSQSDELKTLSESGVASIALASTSSATSYGDGLLVRDGSFTRSDGSTAQAGSFVLAQNTAIREFPPITISAEAQTLPAIGGARWARNLQEAATQSPALVGVVHQAQAAITKADFRQAVADMLWIWGSESAYVSASDEALAEGYGLILSEPQDAQEVGWMDMAVKASTAERNAFRAGLGSDLAKFDAMRERMVGGMTTKINHQDSFMPACRRARRASVPTVRRARGRGACGARSNLRQHRGWRATCVATANWLRPSGTATRHACGGGCCLGKSSQVRHDDHMPLADQNAQGRRSRAVGQCERRCAV
jgi:hypothetical protein